MGHKCPLSCLDVLITQGLEVTSQVWGHSYACSRVMNPRGKCPLNPAGSCSPLSPPPPAPQVFTLPKVSAKTKFKLTAHEGCRVRKVALVSLASAGSEERLENCLACLTNLGDIHIFTVPSLRPQVHYSCIRKEDISGIASCVFTKHGQGEDTR